MHGGVVLSPVEEVAIDRLIASLPDELRAIAEAQFASYNLVQREVDGRALNFYRIVRGRPSHDGMPLQPRWQAETSLVRVSIAIQGAPAPLRAGLVAIGGRAFSVVFDRPVRPDEAAGVADSF